MYVSYTPHFFLHLTKSKFKDNKIAKTQGPFVTFLFMFSVLKMIKKKTKTKTCLVLLFHFPFWKIIFVILRKKVSKNISLFTLFKKKNRKKSFSSRKPQSPGIPSTTIATICSGRQNFQPPYPFHHHCCCCHLRSLEEFDFSRFICVCKNY